MVKTIIALGHKARNGKGEFAEAIYRSYQAVEIMSFGDALREEVITSARELCPTDIQVGLDLLCVKMGVPFDPDAPVEEKYPYGKQRALLQWWGTEYRRDQDPDYWVKRTAEKIKNSKANTVIIDDLRFVNEFKYLGDIGAYRIKLTRLGFESGVANHISETALDGYTFDIELGIPNGRLDILRNLAVGLYSSLQTPLSASNPV